MKLDIGCGNTPSGDINVDLPRSECHRSGMRLVVRHKTNFVYASVYNLPFRNDSFDEVVSFHLLEHLEVPIAALREMARVSNNEVAVVVPAFAYLGECGEHLYSWGEGSLFNILTKAGLEDVRITTGCFREVKGNTLKRIYRINYILGNFTMIFMRRFYRIELQGRGRKCK